MTSYFCITSGFLPYLYSVSGFFQLSLWCKHSSDGGKGMWAYGHFSGMSNRSINIKFTCCCCFPGLPAPSLFSTIKCNPSKDIVTATSNSTRAKWWHHKWPWPSMQKHGLRWPVTVTAQTWGVAQLAKTWGMITWGAGGDMRHCSDSYYYYSCTRDTESSNVAATPSRTTLLTPGLVYRQLLSPPLFPSVMLHYSLSEPAPDSFTLGAVTQVFSVGTQRRRRMVNDNFGDHECFWEWLMQTHPMNEKQPPGDGGGGTTSPIFA